MNRESSQYLSLSQAGKMSGFSPEYLRQLCVSKKLNGEKIGKSWVVEKGVLEEYLNKGNATPNQEKLSLSQAGKLTGYTAEYLRQLCVKGSLSGIKVGASWMIERSVLNKHFSIPKHKTNVKIDISGLVSKVDFSKAKVSLNKIFEGVYLKQSAALIVGVAFCFPVFANLVNLQDKIQNLKTVFTELQYASVNIPSQNNQLDKIVFNSLTQNKNLEQELASLKEFIAIKLVEQESKNSELRIKNSDLSSQVPTSRDVAILPNDQIASPTFRNNEGESSSSSDSSSKFSDYTKVSSDRQDSSPKVLGVSTSSDFITSFRQAIVDGLPSDILTLFKGGNGGSGSSGTTYVTGPTQYTIGQTSPSAINPGTIGGVTYLGAQEISTNQLTVTQTFVVNQNASSSFAGNLSIGGDLTLSGNQTTTGDLEVFGNTTLGNANTDTLTLNSQLASNIVPNITNTYDLGSSGLTFKDFYLAGTITSGLINGQTISSTANFTGSLSMNGAFINTSSTNSYFTGNVGIGTTTPGTSLDVVGQIRGSNGLTISSGTINLPNGQIDNTELANSSLTITAGAGLINGGAVSLGSTTTLNIGAGTCITSNADDIAVTADCIGDTQLQYNTGQHLTTSSTPTFAGLTLNGNLSLGANTLTTSNTTVVTNLNSDLWDGYQFSDYLDQAVKTSSSPTFSTVNTGQGAYELYAMNQNVLSSSSPTFAGLTLNGNLSLGANTLTTSNTTVVTNLNSDLLDGQHGSYYAPLANISGTDHYITKFNGTNALENSVMFDNGTNIGIGTTTPGSKLEVTGDIRITSGSGGQIIFADGSTMSSSGLGSAAALSSSTDAIVTGDSDANGSGDIILKTGSNDRIHILNNGNIGMGTTNPVTFFDVNQKLNILSNGNVGIGTTTPGTSLDVVGTIRGSNGLTISSGTINLPNGQIDNTELANSSLTITAGNGLINGGAVSLGSTTTLNIGAGTCITSNADDVSITSDCISDTQLQYNTGQHLTTSSTPTFAGLTLNGNLSLGANTLTTSNTTVVTNLNSDLLDGQHGSYYAPLANISGTDHYITKFNGTNALENSVMFDNGTNVGVGTTTPGAKLHIADGTSAKINFEKTGTNAETSSIFDDGNLNINSPSQLWLGTTGGVTLTGAANNLTVQGTGNSSIAGNLGIGTTTPGTRLDLAAATNDGDDGIIVRPNNLSQTMKIGWLGFNASYYMNFNAVGDGTTLYSFNKSGVSKLLIDANGNVGIGTTTPGQKLDVNGATILRGQLTFGTDNTYLIGADGANRPYGVRVATDIDIGSTTHLSGTGLSYFNNGNVGIGTTNPLQKLHVKGIIESEAAGGDGSLSDVMYFYSTGWPAANSSRIRASNSLTQSSNLLVFEAGNGTVGAYNANQLVLNGSGNVGIGTTVPRTALEARNTLRLSYNDATEWTDLHTDSAGGLIINASASYIGFYIANSPIVKFQSNGNVGIGTTTPGAKLDVIGASTVGVVNVARFINPAGQTTGNGASILLGVGSFDDGSSLIISRQGSSGNMSTLQFQTHNTSSGVYNTGMFIDSVGNVGIGTTTPSAKLHVIGTTWVDGNLQAVGATRKITLGNDQGIEDPGTADLVIRTGDGEKIRILNTNGNVGIGTTIPAQKLDVQGNINTTGDIYLGSNERLAQNGNYLQILDTGGNADGIKTGGLLVSTSFSNTPTLGNLIVESGNAGIGTTSPQSTLDVNGTVRTRNGIYLDTVNQGWIDTAGGGWPINIGQTNASYIDIGNGAVHAIRSGNVSIGTATAGEKLDVAGNIKIEKTADSAPGTGYNAMPSFTEKYYGSFWNQSTGATEEQVGAIYGIPTASNVGSTPVMTRLTLQAAAAGGTMTDVLSLLGNGNVGIGTTNPRIKFEVVGTNAAESGTATPNGGVLIGTGLQVANSQILTMGSLDGAGNHSWIQSRNSSVASFYSLALNPSGGNVGIGTTNPQIELHINDATGNSAIRLSGGAVNNETYQLQQGIDSISNGGFAIRDVTNSVNRLVIQYSTGNVGIGTTTPGQKLDVNGATILRGQLTFGTDNTYLIGADGANRPYGVRVATDIDIGSTTHLSGTGLSYFNNGNVGIGTTTPSSTLQVYKSGNASDILTVVGATAYGGTQVGTDAERPSIIARGMYPNVIIQSTGNVNHGSTLGLWSYNGSTTTHQWNVGGGQGGNFSIGYAVNSSNPHCGINGYTSGCTSSLTALQILPSGNVGIGTTSPTEKLEVLNGNVYPNGEGYGVIIDSGGNKRVGFIKYGGIEGSLVHGNTTPLRFGQVNQVSVTGGSFTEQMRIDNGGNLGIGTTTPQSRLHVYNPTVGGLNETIRSQGYYNGIGTGSFIRFTNTHSSGTNPNAGEYNLAGIAAYDFQSAWGGALAFQTAGNSCTGGCNLSTRMVIDPDGNVGIGTTTPNAKLHVAAAVSGQSNGDQATIELFNYSPAVNRRLSFRAGYGDQMSIESRDFNGSGHSDGIQVNGGDGVGLGIAGTTYLLVNGTGNVGIGTTTPNTNFQVVGAGGTGLPSFEFRNTRNATNNYVGTRFVNSNSNHSWGNIAEFRTEGGGTDRPSITFSSSNASTTWGVGYGSADDNFRVVQNLGYSSNSWGTPRFYINTSGQTSVLNELAIGGTSYAGGQGWLSINSSGGIYWPSNDTVLRASSGLSVRNGSQTVYQPLYAGGINAYAGGDGVSLTGKLGAAGNAAGWMELYYDGSTRVHISSGAADGGNTYFLNSNIGIGTTTPIHAFDVKPGVASTAIRAGSYAIMENVTTNQAMFGRNIQYASSAAGWTYMNNGYATAIRMYDDPGDGSIAFHLAGSGTAGSSPSAWDSTDAKMVIRNNGNVGIGTMSPGQKLQVNGNVLIADGATNGLYLGQDTGATSYNSISLNGNTTDSGNMGLTGGGGSDTTLYINSPGNIYLRTNSFNNNGTITLGGTVAATTFSGVTVSGGYVKADKNYGFVNADYQAGRNIVWGVSPAAINWGISYFQGGADYFAFHPNGDPNNPLMVVRSPGVGIGTTSPSGMLNVNQDNSIDATSGSNIGAINLTHPTSGGMSAITFKSTVNWPSDGGYLAFYDDNNTYAYWGDSSENGALVLGTTNDGPGVSSDVVVLKSQAAIVLDASILWTPGHYRFHLNTGIGANLGIYNNNDPTGWAFRCDENGACFADGGWNGGADHAEMVKVRESKASYKFGEIVSIDPSNDRGVYKTSTKNDANIMGVISAAPGFISDYANPDSLASNVARNGYNDLPVGISGIVKTQVSTSTGSIKRGDPITSSSISGVGTKANRKGTIVGKALADFPASGQSCTEASSINDVVWTETIPWLNKSAGFVDQTNQSQCFRLSDGTYIGKIPVYVKPGAYDPGDPEFISQGFLEEGDVVKITSGSNDGTLVKANGGYLESILGVVTETTDNGGEVKVAGNGKQMLKVSAENGAITTGDRLTVSKTKPGVAIKMTAPGNSIGTALENFTGDIGKISVFVNLSYQHIDVAVDNTTDNIIYDKNIDMSGLLILNVKAIASISDKWSISEEGVMIAKEIKTEKICFDDVCLDKNTVKAILEKTGLMPTAPVSTPTPTPVVEPTPEPVPEPSPVTEPVPEPVVEPQPEVAPDQAPVIEPAVAEPIPEPIPIP